MAHQRPGVLILIHEDQTAELFAGKSRDRLTSRRPLYVITNKPAQLGVEWEDLAKD
ncbi:hypothetical protein ACTMTJ_34450 [Phytohabitans sp. LJ34]|uniref:hypothetical protein n=1 Tax=Phytohabitans sp. LJ34 TaxID=3452217 RepID=UPI003F89AB29